MDGEPSHVPSAEPLYAVAAQLYYTGLRCYNLCHRAFVFDSGVLPTIYLHIICLYDKIGQTDIIERNPDPCRRLRHQGFAWPMLGVDRHEKSSMILGCWTSHPWASSDSVRRRTTATGRAEPGLFSMAMGSGRGENPLQPNRNS